MEILFIILGVVAILVMVYAFYSALTLKIRIPGGRVKSKWNVLTSLVMVFTVGYLATPFFHLLPKEFKDILVGVIFLAGAIFVVIVIKLYFRIIEDLGL